jgi:hypothetical protein
MTAAAIVDAIHHDDARRHHDSANGRPANNHYLVSRTGTDVNVDIRPDLGGKRQGQECECADQRRPARDGERHGNLGSDMETERTDFRPRQCEPHAIAQPVNVAILAKRSDWGAVRDRGRADAALRVQEIADGLKGLGAIEPERFHEIWNGAVHVAASAGAKPAEKADMRMRTGRLAKLPCANLD